MAKAIKLKNGYYLDTTSIKHDRENLKNILNRYRNFSATVHNVGNSNNMTGVLFNESYGNTDDISLNNGKITISNSVNTIKISYRIRYDWDAEIGTFCNMLTCGGDIWSTQDAINHNIAVQMISALPPFVIDVSNNKIIDLKMWSSDSGTHYANASVYILVEIID